MITRQLSRRFAFPRLSALLLGLLLTGQAVWAGTLTLYYPDAQGNPVVATDIDGNIIWRKHFTPYGKELNGVPDDLGYTGHEYDQETGLTYMQARYYDPVGRFLGIDPAPFDPTAPMTFNRYSYANNNPVRFTDPNGREAACVSLGTTCGQNHGPTPKRDAAFSTAMDFVPVVGDIKGAIEAIQNPSVINISAAVIGLIPVVGDAIGKGLKATTVIGKVADLGHLRQGEQTLLGQLPDLGSPKANWTQNSGVLRKEMQSGVPIRDASVNAKGELINNTGFLRAERNVLDNKGWTYDQKTTMWHPPEP